MGVDKFFESGGANDIFLLEITSIAHFLMLTSHLTGEQKTGGLQPP